MGKIWLPTEVEVFGHPVWSEPGYGTGVGGCNIQYPIFKGGVKHIIKCQLSNNNTRCNWWLASVARTSSTDFCHVGSFGDANKATAVSDYLYVPLCFRIG